MINYLFSILLGTFLGFLTGLFPGANVNNFLPLFLSLSFFEVEALAVFISSFSISQLLTNFFPSIFLGAPSSETSISILPGHKLLLEGRGYEALKLCLSGALFSIIFSSLLVFVFSSVFKNLYYISRPYVFYLIFLVSAFMIISERKRDKILCSLLIFLLSGFVGIIVLNSPLSSPNLLFPMLSGFFGLSTLIISLKEKSFLPKQKIDEELHISKIDFVKASILGSIFGLVVGFLPAVGISQAAVMAQTLAGLNDPRNFLVTIGAISVANEIFSLNSLYLVNNPRSGTSVAIQRILSDLSFSHFLLIISSIMLSSSIVLISILYFVKKFHTVLQKVNYSMLNILVIIFLSSLVFIFTNFIGLLIFITCGAIGILTIELGIRRSHCMGCLLIPSMIFFYGATNVVLTFLFG